MGSAATDPTKKPPAKKAAAPKKASKPKHQKPRGRPTKSSSAAVPVVQQLQLHIPTNLPVCIVDNGGWTVKYGLLPPLPSPTPAVPPSVASGNSAAAAAAAAAAVPPSVESGNSAAAAADKNVEGENDKATNDNDGGENKPTADKEGGGTENKSTTNISSKLPDQTNQQHPTAAPVTLPQHTTNNNINVMNIKMNSMYNATARPPHQLTVLTGDEITTTMKNLGQLSWNYPLERGMVVDGETQLRVWARVLENLSVVAVPQIIKSAGGAFLSSIAANSKRGKHVGKNQPVATATTSSSSLYSSNNCTFLLLEPPFVPSVISEGVDSMLFRELGMARVVRMLGPCMAAMKYLSVGVAVAVGSTIPMNSGNNDYVASTEDGTADANNSNSSSKESSWVNDGTKCCCVVDSGYSFTHIAPTHRGAAMPNAIRRLNIGGKLLTNLLKESVTYRQWNMMDEYHIVNDAKEQLCFLTNQFDKEMKVARSVRKGFRWFDREYLLPDFVNTFRGSVRLPEPLQRKKEMEEMQQIKKELDRLQEDRERQELEDEARDLASMEVDEGGKSGKVDKVTAKDGSKRKKGAKGVNTKSDESKQGKKKKKKRKHSKGAKNDTIAKSEGGDEDDADMDDSENDSDEENDQQRLKRLKAMRDAERRRREQESHERQALAMSVERFAIPEVLFRPSDIGLDIGGIAESIVESINSCDAMYRAAMYHNVLLVGGNANIPGFRDRVELELRRLAPTNYEVRVYLPEDPASYAWEGAKEFSQQPDFQERFSVDRLSWEAMKKAGKNQLDIWGDKMYNAAPNRK